MSTQHNGPTRTRSLRPAPSGTPRLRVVPRGAGVRHGSGFVVVLALLLVSGLVGLLLLNLSMQNGAFELNRLQVAASELVVDEQALDQELERIQSSQNLAQQATRQGMVQNLNPVFLDLSDGSVIGKPVAALPGQTLPGLSRPEPPTRPDIAAPKPPQPPGRVRP